MSADFAPARRLARFAAAACLCAALILAAGAASAQNILRDAEIEKWLDDYSRPVFKAAGLPAEAVDIYILGDQSPNAFIPGPQLVMVIHTGLFTTADKPNQVLGVIAHETGHMAGGHGARTQAAMGQASRPILLSLLLGAGAIAAGAPDAGLAALALGQTIGTAEFLRYSRGQEATADQAAVTYLDRLGKSSKGLQEFFAKLRNYQVIRARAPNPYLQTHPLANQRVEALRERVESSPYYGEEDSPEEIRRFELIQAKIHGFLDDPNAALRLYPHSDTSDPARYARAVAYYRTSQLDRALREIDTLLEAHPDNPYFWELKGQMLFEHGQIEEAIAPHAKSAELAPATPLLRVNLARAYVATERPDYYQKAVTELKAALLIEPNNAFGWTELARAYSGLGETALADFATAEARYAAGANADAYRFAARARQGLPEGSPEWRKAGDIMIATEEAARRGGNGGRGRFAPDERATNAGPATGFYSRTDRR